MMRLNMLMSMRLFRGIQASAQPVKQSATVTHPHVAAQFGYATSAYIRQFKDTNRAAAEAEALLSELESAELAQQQPQIVTKVAHLATEAANQGSARGKTILASLHREGLGVTQDTTAAIRLFEDAAARGDPIAQCSLGSLLLDRVIEKTNNPEGPGVGSSEIVVELDEEGKPHARVELTTADGKPIKDAPAPAELVRRVRKARKKAGFTDAQSKEFEEHKRQENERRLAEERKVAMRWLEAAIEQGNDTAMVIAANEIVQKDTQRAVELYTAAIKANRNTDAYYNLGQIYTKGMDGIEADEKSALKNFAMAAQLGDASAQFYLGHLYRVGTENVDVDFASSRQYVELSAAQGHPAALYYLALMHRHGEGGLEASEGAFLRYVTEAAKNGHGRANECLGDMYYKGTDGVAVDYEKALKYFTAAGKLGESDALCSAAAMHFHGYGTACDHHEALLLYQEAAQLGNNQALRSIGSMYFYGQGVPVNKKLAEQFVDMADEAERKVLAEGQAHTNTEIKITEAPKHPMADIPRDIQDPSYDPSEAWSSDVVNEKK